MKDREEVIELFTEFVLTNDLETSDLLIVVECATREMAARQTIHTNTILQVMNAVLEEERV